MMSKKDVKVSVIIPVYNAEEHLQECLDSIINQTLKDIEIICVDDGSTDGSLQILNSYAQKDERIQVLTQQNKFAGVARNTGMSVANGKYYVFLDSDDFFEPDLLESEYTKCEEYDADIAVCAADKFDNKTKEFQPAPWLLDISQIKEEPFSKDTVSNIYGISAANPWTKMFSSEFVKKHGLQFQALQRSNDAFFVLTSLALAKRIVAVDKVLVHYRVGQTTNLQSNTTTTDSFCKALSEVKRHLEKCNEFEKVEQSFANIVLAQIQYNLSTFASNQEKYDLLLNLLKTVYIPQFQLAKYPPEFFYNKYLYSGVAQKCGFVYEPITPPEKKDSPASFEDDDNGPLISILIPVYNTSAYLETCLNSVINQTLRNIEIICVNDGSTDSSPEILAEYAKNDSRIVIINQKNSGLFMARKVAVEKACGRYIMFLDSDDYIETNACEELYNSISTNNVDILQFGTFVDATSEVPESRVSNVQLLLAPYCHKLENSILENCFIHKKFRFSIWNKIYSSHVVKKAYSQLPEDRIFKAEDLYAFFAITYYAKSFYGVANQYYHYRFGAGITGRSSINMKTFTTICEQSKVIDSIKSFLTKNNAFDEYEKVYEIIYSELLNEVIGNWDNYLISKHYTEAWNLIIKNWDAVKAIEILIQKYSTTHELAKKFANSDPQPQCEAKEIKTIGIFYHRLTPGGVQRVLALQIPIYIKMGYKVVLLTDEDPTKNDYKIPANVERIVISAPAFPKSRIKELTEAIKNHGIDVFIHHATSSPFLLFDLLAIKSCKIPVGIVIHEAYVAQMSKFAQNVAYKHFIFKMADIAITLSSIQETYWKALGVNAKCILNPLTYTEPTPNEIKEGNHNLIWVGRIADDKNCADAIRILAQVVKVYPDTKLIVVGKAASPQKHSEVSGLIAYYKLKQNVLMVGETDDVAQHYKNAAVYLLTSLSESYSMTLAESKMFGIPAVIYSLPYIDLSNPEFGTISVPQQNISAAANEIIKLFSIKEYMDEQASLSRNGATWLINYSQEKKWTEVFDSFKEVSCVNYFQNSHIAKIADSLFFHYLLSCKEFANVQSASKKSSISPQQSTNYDSLITRSWSYRIGRLITFVPRKVRGGIRCYKEHGFKYTVKRFKEHFISVFKK